MRKQKIIGISIVIIEVLVILLSCGKYIRHNGEETVTISPDQFGYAADIADGESDERASQGAQILGSLDSGTNRRLVTPKYHLYPGLYQADVFYTSNIPIGSMSGANISAYDDNTYSCIKSESLFLSSKDTHANFYINVYEETDSLLRLIMDDDSASDITVDHITLTRLKARSLLPNIISLFTIFCIVDIILILMFYKKQFLITHGTVIFSLCVITLVSSIPLFAGSLLKGYDMRFHYFRVYALADGLRSGNFPVYIYPDYANNYGYAVGVFYPDTFLYIPAVLYLLGYRLETAYMFLMFLINLMTALLSFYSFKKISGNIYSGLVGSVVYTMALPRLVALYTRGALGAALAYIFAPLLALGLIEMIRAKDGEEGHSWIHVAIAMSGILSSHLLGGVMAVMFSLLFAIINLKKVLCKDVLINIGKSVLGTALLSAHFIIPFLSGVMNIDINSGANSTPIFNYAALPAQLFTNSFNIIGDVNEDTSGMLLDMPMTLGLATLGALLVILVFATRGYIKKNIILLENVGILFIISLWMSSTLFPYRWLSIHMKFLYDFLTKFQFAYRFLAVGTLASAIIIVLSFESISISQNLKKALMGITVIGFMFQGMLALDDYSDMMIPFE